MLGALKRRWKTTTRRPTLDSQHDENEDFHPMGPQRVIEIKDGKISLVPVRQLEAAKDKAVLAARIAELEEALARLQEKVNNQSQCESPTLEKDLKEQLENMNRAMKTKDRRAMQALRDNKTLQARFQRQENCLQHLSTENKNLHQRIRQYEHCLDDVMRKVVDAIVAEDNLREEVTMLKNRVRDLEAQNAALSSTSPAKGRDEGYCTMSSGQPQPCAGHLEDLPEEPEQLLMLANEPCSADMEDWSMSQEELGAALEEDNNEADWLWHSSSFLNSAVDSQSETISQLLQDTIEYSDNEEIGCKDFTRDFYKLVNINSESTRSLQATPSHLSSRIGGSGRNGGGYDDVDGGCGADIDDSDTDDSSDNTTRQNRRRRRLNGDTTTCYSSSPTPSEAGRAQVSSCSSSDSSGDPLELRASTVDASAAFARTDKLLQDVLIAREKTSNPTRDGTQSMPTPLWRRSNGWRRISSQQIVTESLSNNKNKATKKDLKIPPPVPLRRSYVS